MQIIQMENSLLRTILRLHRFNHDAVFLAGECENSTVPRSGTGLNVGESGASTTEYRSILRNQYQDVLNLQGSAMLRVASPLSAVWKAELSTPFVYYRRKRLSWAIHMWPCSHKIHNIP